MASSTFPPTPTMTSITFPPTPTRPTPTTTPVTTSSVFKPPQQIASEPSSIATVLSTQSLFPLDPNGVSSASSSVKTSVNGPGDAVLTTSSANVPIGIMMSTSAAGGIFGVGTHLDPLIIFGLVVAGLVVLVLLAALIYCCCAYCGVPARQNVATISRVPSMRSIQLVEDSPYFIETGRGGTRVTQRVIGTIPIRVRQEVIQPDDTVTKPVIVRTVRKKYMYPTDSIRMSRDLTYNSTRPKIITTLGDGYVQGPSLRATGSYYGNRGLLLFDDSPSTVYSASAPHIITLDD